MSNNDDLSKKLGDFSKKTGALTQEKIMQTLDWSYETTLNGLPGQKNVNELVNDYLSKYDKETAIKKLVNYQTTKATVSGFVTGFGGFMTMPVTLPANITTVILFQMRMIAAIATIRSYDLNSDQTQTFVYATLAGTSVADIMKKSGIVFGNKLTVSVIKKIPGTALTKINQAVGFRFVTKFGSKGIINLGKMVPFVGAGFGGAFDMISTKTIARVAQNTFTEVGINLGDGTIIEKNC